MKSLSKLIIGVLVLSFLGCQKEHVIENNSNSILYSFFVAGHTYGKPGVDNIGLHPAFEAKYDLIRNDSFIEFGVLTGDIVLTGTEQNWNEVDSSVSLLDLPVYFAVGNHDMSDRVLFESRYGQTYQSFVRNSDLFIILDPNIDNWNISGEQLQFLENTLDENYQQVENIYVFFHQLLWWTPNNIYKNVTLNSLQSRSDTINFWAEVEPLFNTMPNNIFMFAGDVGANPTGSEFMYHQYDNMTLIASGMGGEVRDNIIIVDVFEDKTTSFRLIALNEEDINALGKLEDYELP